MFAQVLEADPSHSSLWILAGIGALATLATVLHFTGVIAAVLGFVASVVRAAVRRGFTAWSSTLAWARWPILLLLGVALIVLGERWVEEYPAASILLSLLAMFMGTVTCLACIHLGLERYEVERGYKAVHNPLKGQEHARDLARHGHRVGVPLLACAAIILIGGFALLNHALYWSIGARWYLLHDPDQLATYPDFLVYAIINLYRVVDLLDLANHNRLVRLAHLQPKFWVASLLLAVFKTFFTFVLLEQIFASIRKGKLLGETITDFFSPHKPIHDRASRALPHYGVGALEPLLRSLGSGSGLTKEQREELPELVANIGPATVPALVARLGDPDEQVRAVAAGALGRLHAYESLSELAKLGDDPSELVRLSRVEAIGILASPGSHPLTGKRGRLPSFAPLWLRTWARRRAAASASADPVGGLLTLLLPSLADVSPVVRVQAAKTLGQLRGVAKSSAASLLPLLADEEENVRCEAAEALSQVGADAEMVVPALTPLLDDPSPAVKAAAATALGVLGAAAAPAVPALVPLLQDRDESVRQAASIAIGKAGTLAVEAAASLVAGLASPDTLVRARAAEAIGNIGKSAEAAAPALVKALEDSNDRVRAKAAEALGKIGAGAAEVALPRLMRALRDPDTWVQALAAEALGEMGAAADEAVPALTRSLRHANAQVRYSAAESLGNLGDAASEAVPSLERACEDEDGGVRALALRALSRIGPLSPRTQALVRQCCDDADPQVRLAAVTACERPEELEEATSHALFQRLDDAHDPVKVRAASLLARRGKDLPDLVERLVKLVSEDDNPWVREHAAASLGGLGEAALSAAPALAQAMQTGEARVRDAALRALVRLQPSDATAAFLAGLKDEFPEIRKVASAAWHKADTIPEEAIPGLVHALNDPEAQVAANAAFALGRMDELPDDAIPRLVACTLKSSRELKLNAALALRNTTGSEVHDAMAHLLQDPSPRIRLLAAGSLLSADPADALAAAVVEAELADESPALRKAAVALLATLGAAVQPWLPRLQQRLAEEADAAVRRELEAALAATAV